MALIDTIPKNYDPQGGTDETYQRWESAGLFAADPSAPGEPYCIVIPPPNVTGSLHMGHALNNTLQDVLIRYKRMDGYNTLWIPGTDHASIAVHWVLERKLRQSGLTRHDLGRDEFMRMAWEWKKESGDTIFHQLRKLGVSCDWSRARFTMDEGLSAAVREVFVRYYEQGLIHRAERLINWDPVGLTALSDLEVQVEEDHQTEIWRFAYPLAEPVMGPDGQLCAEIVVATTRPETMLGDTAVAVHPEDERYKHLIGRNVRHPILGREFPIIGDALLVDPAFGTGAVKLTPAHDFNDFAAGQRHNLPQITILTLNGRINENGGPDFVGLDRFEARKKVQERIADLGLARGSSPHTMALPRSERSGAVVEPMLSTQWYVKMAPLAGPAVGAVEHGFTRFVPAQWENTYFAWMRNIQDWCISRQLWWGHRIPAWYCDDCGHITVTRHDPSACEKCGSERIRQDEDVLDTWFSSALWAFSTMGWPERHPDLARYYPTSVLITGFDIIFFWVARMVFSGIHFMGQVPFKDVYIHALVRDEQGQKMSKTKGNVVDPLDMISRYGVDAFRYTLVSMAAQGRDILWSEKRVDSNLKFQNKIWQAFRFAAMHLEHYGPGLPRSLSPYDHWIRARLGETIRRVRGAMDQYRFNEAATELYAFIWDELCDWYVELSKGTLYSEDPALEPARQGARHTLWEVWHALIRLSHPIMPFLTDALWSHLPGTSGELMKAPYPRPGDFPDDAAALIEVAALQETIVALRRLKADMGLSPKVELSLRCAEPAMLQRHAAALRDLARIVDIRPGSREGVCATAVAAGQSLYVPLDGVIDVAAERERLQKELDKVQKDRDSLLRRLETPGFKDRAPAAVVADFEAKLAAAAEKVGKLEGALSALS